MTTTIPRVRNILEWEIDSSITTFNNVLDLGTTDNVIDFMRHGSYQYRTLLDGPYPVAVKDISLRIMFARPTMAQLTAFDAFVAEGSAFTKPYGMLSVLSRLWQFSITRAFYMIIVTLISDDT